MAAVWTRDGRIWRISSGLTADQVRQQDERNKKDKFLPVDVAGYMAIDEDGKPADRYAALWVEESGDDEARLYVGTTADEEAQVEAKLKDEKLIPRTLHAMMGSDGRTRYCGIWGRPPENTITSQTYRDQSEGNFEEIQANLSDQLLIDVVVSGVSMKVGHLDRRYAAVWSSDAAIFEAIPIYGLDPVAHLQKCRELILRGLPTRVLFSGTDHSKRTASNRLRLASPRDQRKRPRTDLPSVKLGQQSPWFAWAKPRRSGHCFGIVPTPGFVVSSSTC